MLQRDLNSVTEWSVRHNWSLRNKMKLHTDKFEFLLHGVSRDPLMHQFPFTTDIFSRYLHIYVPIFDIYIYI